MRKTGFTKSKEKGREAKMKVKTYCINKGTASQYFGLENAEENQVLHSAPNNWKTERGAERWAVKHGFTLEKQEVQSNV